jgi:hypothetical protein
MTRGFAELIDLVLGPLAGRPDAAWYRAPPGKWHPAQIVEHLAISMEATGLTFEKRRAHEPMVRRPRRLIQKLGSVVILRLGWYPRGFTAPDGTRPAADVTRTVAEARFRAGYAKWLELPSLLLPARRYDLFVRHPLFGDLTVEEWMRFHVVHCRHHAKQIRARLAA